ncbi:hypothetical protein FGO68_gene3600 [Halteria grandinella]|uniref:RING-type domain-containing protein n=1 Tax=Halteria grandinella TaxID=5974 RepID=A0A8J8NI83_HALGN|nr:hypothetical protein FGO68_gene3600 [Halteria grandinella]
MIRDSITSDSDSIIQSREFEDFGHRERIIPEYDDIDGRFFQQIDVLKQNDEGLNNEKWESLTETVFRDDAPNKYLECYVCQEEFNNGNALKVLGCSHMFHKDCIRPWFDKRDTCPLCRVAVQ